ncbi:MAG: hypothetical protein ACYTCV_12750 [Planctomycetota bacterium]|jgi:hypothetical protein
MPDRHWIFEPLKDAPAGPKNPADLSHAGKAVDQFAVAGGNPRRFLAAVLKTVKRKICFMYRIRITIDSEYAALFFLFRH